MDCNSQTNGLDYQVTFGLLVKMNSFRVLLSLAVNLYWPLHQFEVKKNAFLLIKLEEVHMCLSTWFQGLFKLQKSMQIKEISV